MQAHIVWSLFRQNCILPNLIKNKFPFMLPSHNCIIITMFSFQGASLNFSFKKLNEASISWNFSQSLEWWRVPGSNRWPPACKAGALPAELTPHRGSFGSGGPKWTRFPPGKPRRLQQSTGLLPRAGFRVHFMNSMLFALTAILFGFQLIRSGGPKWTRTIDLTIISRVL